MIHPIAFTFGFIHIRWYAICIILGLVLAIFLSMKEAPRRNIRSEDVLEFILIAFPLALIGARIYYVAFKWSDYQQNPAQIFAIWQGGIAIYGGLITGLLVCCCFAYYRLINVLDFLDVITPGVLIAQSIGRWGNFFNQEAYGRAVRHLQYVPDFIRKQMYIDGSYHEPTFLYESLWNLLGFVILMFLRRKKNYYKRGQIASFYLIWYGSGRAVIEGLRTDSLMFLHIRVSQLLSIGLVLLGIVAMISLNKKKGNPYYQN